MEVIDISSKYPLVEHIMSYIRDYKYQLQPLLFKKNIFTLGQILAINVSCYLDYKLKKIITPFGIAECKQLVSEPTIIPIMRAGLALQEGISSILEDSPIGCCYCPKGEDGNRHAILHFTATSPDSSFVICDPIIATGKSIISTENRLREMQRYKNLYILSVIATGFSLSQMEKMLPDKTTLLTCAIDEFTPGVKGTRPGLGDVGDLLYGKKY